MCSLEGCSLMICPESQPSQVLRSRYGLFRGLGRRARAYGKIGHGGAWRWSTGTYCEITIWDVLCMSRVVPVTWSRNGRLKPK